MNVPLAILELDRRNILFWSISLLAVDAILTLVSQQTGSLHLGRSPLLDLWDLAKALAIGVLLLTTARRVGSRGLTVIGFAAILVGTVGGTHLHGVVAGWLLPGARTGVGKFAVLMTAVIVAIVVLFAVRDSWPHYPRVRGVTILLLAGLLVTAGLLDLIGAFRGAALIEESAERLVMSISLAFAMALRNATGAPGLTEKSSDLTT